MAFNYIHIGKIAASFGVEGSIIVSHKLGKKTTFKQIKAIFIEEVKGSPIPYFITNAKAKDAEETIVNVEGVTSKEAAKRIIGKPLWLLEEDFRKLASKETSLLILGYTVIDDDKEIGIIEEVIEQPHQILLTVNVKGKQAYVPMHQDNLENIDHKKKQVVLNIPEGLLDVYN